MSLSSTQISKLKKLIRLAQALLANAESTKKQTGKGARRLPAKRIRRAGNELIAFRKLLKSERKKGVAVEKLAKTHGVSTAYIYQIGT